MSRPFDPYYTWLGIPERERPPHYYRLLGLSVFEADPDVIANAADARMGFVRTFQTGSRAAHSQRILNELATARVCLLNKEKKAQYDAQLQEQLDQQAASSSSKSLTPPGSSPSALGSSPSALGSSPSALGSSPSALGSSPSALGSSPSALGSSPSALGSSPSALGSSPSALGSSPSALGNGSASWLGRAPGDGAEGPQEASVESSSVSVHLKAAAATIWCDPKQRCLAIAGVGLLATLLICLLVIGLHSIVRISVARQEPSQTAGQNDSREGDPAGEEDTKPTPTSTSTTSKPANSGASEGKKASGTNTKAVSPATPVKTSSQGALTATSSAGTSVPQQPKDTSPSESKTSPAESSTAGKKSSETKPAEKPATDDKPDSKDMPKEDMPKEGNGKTENGKEAPEKTSGDKEKEDGKKDSGDAEKKGKKTSSFADHDPDLDPDRVLRKSSRGGGKSKADQADKKLAVPGDSQQQTAEQAIRRTFHFDPAAPMAMEPKRQLAKRMAEEADKTKEDRVAAFVLVRMASDLASDAADLEKAFEYIDAINEKYSIDVADWKADAVTRAILAVQGAKAPLQAVQQVALTSRTTFEDLVENEQYESAARVLVPLLGLAKKRKDTTAVRDLAGRGHELNRLKKEYSPIKMARDRLAEKPDDAEANQTVGEWLCLTKGRWSEGLPMLAKGSKPALVDAAQKDLAEPAKADAQLALADLWKGLADKAKGTDKNELATRAIHWYDMAIPELAGLPKAKAEKDAEAARVLMVGGSGRGLIQRGNVALASNGTTVVGPSNGSGAETLIDGNSTKYDSSRGFTYAPWPNDWAVTFKQPYQLREVRIRLWDKDPRRYYRFQVAVSADGTNFTMVADRSRVECRSWQVITFRPQQVKVIKVRGLFHSTDSYFSMVELEAYCISPPYSPLMTSDPP